MPEIAFDGLLDWSRMSRKGSTVSDKQIIIAVQTERFGVVQVIQDDHPAHSIPRTTSNDPDIQMFPKRQQRKILALCAAVWGILFGNQAPQ